MYNDRKNIDFRKTFARSDTLCIEQGYYEESGSSRKLQINLTTPLTKCIQQAGRFCEYYASDLFISWNEIIEYTDSNLAAGDSKLFLLGFRKSGVDHEEFIVNGSSRYRCIYGIEVACLNKDPNRLCVTFTLKDLTNNVIGLTD